MLAADGVSRALGRTLVSLTVPAAAAWGAASLPLPKQQNQENIAQCVQVICIIDAKQHPTVQILSLQSGNLSSPSSSRTVFSPTFHPVRLPPTHHLPTRVLSFFSHQEPDTSVVFLYLSALQPPTYHSHQQKEDLREARTFN